MQVRLWDPERCEKTQKSVIKVYGRGRRKGEVSTVCMDGCGSVVCVPVCDGSLQVFPVHGPFHRPAQTVPAAFAPGDTVCSLCFVREKETVVLRTLGGLVRLWDLRSTRQPLAARSDVAALYDGTEVITDPRHKFVVAGAAGARDRGSRLVFMDASTLETVREVEDSAVATSLLWHPKLNQVCPPRTPSRSCHHVLAIMLSLSHSCRHSRSVGVPDVPVVLLLVLVGAWCLVLGAWCLVLTPRRAAPSQLVVGLNNGSSKVLFDPTRSERGALLPLSRRRFKGEERLYDAPLVIVNPDTLPTKRERIEQARRDAADPRKTHTPAVPSGPGTNGRLASNFTEQIIRQIGIKKLGDDDPTEALRRLGAAAAGVPHTPLTRHTAQHTRATLAPRTQRPSPRRFSPTRTTTRTRTTRTTRRTAPPAATARRTRAARSVCGASSVRRTRVPGVCVAQSNKNNPLPA